MKYSALQNGSDIRGVAMGEAANLTEAAARELAQAFVAWLSARTGRAPGALRLAVGCDSRLTARALTGAACLGAALGGADVCDCGLASTPAMFMATVLDGCRFDGSIMVTASHLPSDRNGLKFFTPQGGAEKEDVAEIIRLAEAPAEAAHPGKQTVFDVMGPYCAHLRGVIRRGAGGAEAPLSGFRIAVDAGNGAGGFFAREVLAPLGADISASRFLDPDGRFPNHIPNPENAAAMDSIRDAVLSGGCDLGVIFDTDVDRAGAVDRRGDELCRNRLIALVSAIVAREHPGAAVVTDSVTSDQLAEFLTHTLRLTHRRYMRGYRNVINEAQRLCAAGVDAELAMETSGHAALRENYFLDDGAYLCCKIIVEMARLRREGRDLDSLLTGLGEPKEAREIRIRILDPDYRACGQRVLEELAQYSVERPGWVLAPDNCEGLRFSLPAWQGWFLLRMSLHEALMPLNIESSMEGGVDAILSELLPFLNARRGLEKTEA